MAKASKKVLDLKDRIVAVLDPRCLEKEPTRENNLLNALKELKEFANQTSSKKDFMDVRCLFKCIRAYYLIDYEHSRDLDYFPRFQH